MTFSRTVLLGVGAWVALITFLHITLNWSEAPSRFWVGFLPVT